MAIPKDEAQELVVNIGRDPLDQDGVGRHFFLRHKRTGIHKYLRPH